MAAQKKGNKGKVIQMLSPENYIKQKARSLPIEECWINSDWEEDGLANIMVTRKHTNNNVTVGMYLTDLKCLGIKDAQYFFNLSPAEYRDLQFKYREYLDIESINYIHAHNIIYAGIEFAEDYGFKPHKDFGIAEYILEEDTDDIELMEIPCGKEDKPFYVRGPLDSDIRAKQIIAQLEKTAGSGNYHFIDTFDKMWDDDIDEDEFDSDEFDGNEKLDDVKLFLDYFSRLDKLSDDESEDMDDLIDSIFIDFVDLEKVEVYYDDLMSAFERIKVVQEVPLEMVKDLGIASEQLDELRADFFEVEKLIDEGHENAHKRLKIVTKKYLENAATRYLNLFLLYAQEARRFNQFLEESIKSYPYFPLINLLSQIDKISKEKDGGDVHVNSEIDVENVIDKFFPNRKILYSSEVFYFMQYLILYTSDALNMECIEALGDMLYEIELSQEYVGLLGEFIKLAKITFIIGLIDGLASKE